MSRRAIGLDISDRSVKFLELRRRRGGFAVGSFGEIAVPAGVIDDGKIRDEAELVRLLKGIGLGKRSVVASLPDEHGLVRRIELPAVRSEDLLHAVRWELEGLMSMPLPMVSYDYHSIPHARTAVHERALVVAYPRAISDSYHRVLAAAGISLLALEPESQAIARAIIPAGNNEPHLIADIGAVRTSIISAEGEAIVSATSLPFGGRDIEAAIARGLGVSSEKARAIKIYAGIDHARHGGRIRELVLPELDRFAAALGGASGSFRGTGAPAVYLCGGDANLIGIQHYLAAVLKQPVLLADPFINAKSAAGAVPPMPRSESLRYTAAIGLALRQEQ